MHPFEFNKIGKVVNYGKKIYFRKYPNVQWEVDNFGEENAVYTCKVYRDYRVYSYSMEGYEIEGLHEAIQAQNIEDGLAKQKLYSLRSPLHSANPVDFNKKLSEGVLQGEYAITLSSSNKPILGTYGAGPCLIVAIYDVESKISFLAHIDGVTDLDSLKTIINRFNPETSQVHLYGGDISSEEMCIEVVEIFKSLNFEIYNSDIVRQSLDRASLAIDSRNGKIYSPVQPDQLETRDEMHRLQLAEFIFGKRNLRKIYDGMEDISDNAHEISPSLLISNSLFSTNNTTDQRETNCGFKPGFLLNQHF